MTTLAPAKPPVEGPQGMTTHAIARHFRANAKGRGRYVALCPAHPDRSPSLTITEGHAGRTLLRCWAGCRTEDVLEKLGLSWANICGEPMTRAQAREAAVERQEREVREQKERAAERAAFNQIRELHAIADELGSRLATDPEVPGSDAIAALFHQTLDRIRQAEAVVTR